MPIARKPLLRRAAGLLPAVLACGASLAQPQAKAVSPEAATISPLLLELQTAGGPLPIRLELTEERGGASPRFTAAVVNGRERVEAGPVTVEREAVEGGFRDRVEIRFERFGSVLRWSGHTGPAGTTGIGAWSLMRGSGPVEVPFTVRRWDRGHAPNGFGPAAGAPASPHGPAELFGGTWAVEFAEGDPSLANFEIGEDGLASGTFLTPTGDYRFLTGRVDGPMLRLSTFDGAHAFLFAAVAAAPGRMVGGFWSGDWHFESWRAERPSEAVGLNLFAQTEATAGGSAIEELVFPDLDGRPTRVGDVAPAGSPRVIEIMGSWCPNCHDASRFLNELHEEYGPRGLRIVGLSFEHVRDEAAARARVREFVEAAGVRYPVLIAGPSDKAEASERVPFLDEVRAYPTTVFLGADGEVAAVHSGYAGPATGAVHEQLRARFRALIEGMLAPERGGAGDGE